MGFRMPKKSKGAALYQSKVEASVICPQHEYSRAFGPGAIVDMAEEIAPGLALGDCVEPEWFEPVGASSSASAEPAEGEGA